MKKLELKAYGKINLGLDVIGTLPNKYHDLRMIMQTVGIYDTVVMEKRNDGQIVISTNLEGLPNDERNLAYKAARLLMDEFKITEGVTITIDKVIPMAGGMAGGSADCAAVLKGMNSLFDLKLNEKELMARGVNLGADVPYCITGGTVLAEGIGDRLTKLPPVPNAYIIIAKPGVSVSTKYVYDKIDSVEIKNHPDTEAMINAINKKDLHELAGLIRNVLEDVTVKEYSAINDIKQTMLEGGALNAMMSGSGPTVFGIFDDRKKAKETLKTIKEQKLAEQLYITEFV